MDTSRIEAKRIAHQDDERIPLKEQAKRVNYGLLTDQDKIKDTARMARKE